jgi:hypothetical protein
MPALSIASAIRKIAATRGADKGATEAELGDLWLDRPEDGRALYAHRQQKAARRSGNGEVERGANIYSGT